VAGAASTWDAGAVSTKGIISADGYVEMVSQDVGSNRLFGLSNGDSTPSYTEIDFAISIVGTQLYLFESGIQKATIFPHATGDVLRVAVENGVVVYRKNGAVLYTSSSVPRYPLLVDTSIYTVGATLGGVVIAGVLENLAAPTPVLSPAGGTFTAPQLVTVGANAGGAEIHYTMNGAEPTAHAGRSSRGAWINCPCGSHPRPQGKGLGKWPLA
jgi:hypothetical protein